MSRLKRTFSNISDEAFNDIERAQIFAQMGLSGTLDWELLLKSPRVLIVSEAGSGKTYECQQERKRLWDLGEAAFYLELAQLAQSDIRTQLSPEEEGRFDSWRISQSGTATFFLDSFDELKLTQGSFKAALIRLEKVLERQLDRACIVITTRPIPFEEEEFKRRLPVSAPRQETERLTERAFAELVTRATHSRQTPAQANEVPNWLRVHLMPLSAEQIREMISNQDIGNPEELLAAIHQRNAEDFTRRPLDLIELCVDWRECRRIRTHQEQLKHNIYIKLKPRSDREELAELSPEKALDGASRLAFACLLSRKLTLRHSIESDKVPVAESALDPASVLCDWNEKERKTLLERALFGIANYGRVRFHHRSVIEFLAAQQLKKLLNAGMAIKTLKQLLFAETPHGIKVIKPGMRPVAAWLAEFNQVVFREILEREPEVLLDFGDPESLQPSQRNTTLQAYIERYKLGSWRGMHIPSIQIHRFSDQELAPVIRECWEVGIENPEVRELLIEIVGAGKISECANLVLAVATDDTAELRERRMALETLHQLDDQRIPDVLAAMQNQLEKWPEPLLKAAVLSFFPTHLSIEQLASLLVRTSEPRLSVGDLSWQWPRLIAECVISSEYLEALRSKLTDLVMEQAETIKSGYRYSTSRPHLVNVLAAVCLRQLTEDCRSEGVFKSSAAVLRFSQDEYVSQKEPVTNLQKQLAALPDQYRGEIFWADVAFTQSFQPEVDPWLQFNRILNYGPLQLNAQRDSVWIRNNLVDKMRPSAERKFLLELAIYVVKDKEKDREKLSRTLMPLVADCQELSDYLGNCLQPVRKNPEHIRWEKRAQKAEVQRKRREAKDFASWISFWREVSSNPGAAFSQDRKENTAWNLWNAATRAETTEVAGWNRPFIEKYFNKEIADRLRVTLMAIWREDRPTLRCERPEGEKNSYLNRWQMGLSAIYAESEDQDWARKLNYEEALLAARYVPIESNRFPTWLQSLAVAHPLAIETILGAELAGELAEIAKPNAYYRTLQYLRHESQLVIGLFIPQLLAWLDSLFLLQKNEDLHMASERLRMVFKLLFLHGSWEVIATVKKMVEKQLARDLDTPFASVWLPALLGLSPATGSQILINGLEGRETAEDTPGVRWIAQLFGDRNQEKLFDLSAPGFTPELLLELLRLAYKHVRPTDDISHEGTYSPGARDHAQRGRGILLDAVLSLGGPKGWAIKLEMANDPLFIHFRDRALLLAREKVAQEIDSRIYDIGDIVDLYQTHETPPATSAELFELMLNRLDDLEDTLLHDDSPRELWATIQDEKIMRREIARVLATKANATYTVDQEGVTADEKETDIRLRVAKHDLQGVIELKLGDGRSGRDLRDTLKNQIVMKYMGPENRRAGCLLVTVARDKTWEHPETGTNLDIEGLRNMLEVEASRIVTAMGWSLKLAAKVLDLRARLPKEKQRQKRQEFR